MPAAKMFDQLARPVSHADDGNQWHGPVTTLQANGNEFQLYCELPRLDPQLDATPWLVLPDCPGAAPDLARVAPLRRTDTAWWALDPAGAPVSEWGSLQDVDLQRWIDDICTVADCLDLPQFHVLAGGFSSAAALALAAHHPKRVSSMVLESVFIPFRPVANAYVRALHKVDSQRFEAVFRRQLQAQDFAGALLEMDVRDGALACTVWAQLESRLGLGAIRLEEGCVIRSRRTLAHYLLHDFFISPRQWNEDVEAIAHAAMPVTLVQGLGDAVCLPSGGRFLADLLPQANLVELPDVGHAAVGSLAFSAVAGAIGDHRRPRARLLTLPLDRGRSFTAGGRN
jgi:pimeloyl-ACP methyl ester carboxylesterase